MLLCEFVSYCFNYYLCNIIIKFNIHFILNSCKEIHFYIVCCHYCCFLLMKTIKVLKSDYRDFTFIIKIDVSWNGIKIAVFVRSCEIALIFRYSHFTWKLLLKFYSIDLKNQHLQTWYFYSQPEIAFFAIQWNLYSAILSKYLDIFVLLSK